TLPAGTYNWYVDAIASCDNTRKTQSTSTFSFTVTAACPDVTTLMSPAEGASVASGNVTLNWKSVTNATSYSVYAGIDGAALVFIGSTTNSSLTRTIDGGKSIEWYVVS